MFNSQQQQQQQQQQQLQYQQRVKQQIMLQQAAMLQQPVYHPQLLSAMAQMEPIPNGNLPPGFDSSSCRSVYVGNIHPKVTDSLMIELFSGLGLLEGCKLIRKDKSSYGFVDYYDHRSAAAALVTLNGRHLFGQAIKVNWAYASGTREDTAGHVNIFVGDLSPEVTDASLFAAFSLFPGCSDARVMWDQKSGRSRGFGFVSYRSQAEAQVAMQEMSVAMGEDLQGGGVPLPVVDGGGAETNPNFLTVYVGNLAHEVTDSELHRQFYSLSVGTIEEVRVQHNKGFGFVRYSTHEEAAAAILAANGKVVCGKSIKCSWGSKPTLTPAAPSSGGLPPPSFPLPQPPSFPPPADLLSFQRTPAVTRPPVPLLPPSLQQLQLQQQQEQLLQMQAAGVSLGVDGSLNILGGRGGYAQPGQGQQIGGSQQGGFF